MGKMKIKIPDTLEDAVMAVLGVADKIDNREKPNPKLELRELKRLRDTLIAADLNGIALD